MNSYIICATPRTGSTLLCDLLTSTGVAGAPDSFFMNDVDPHWAAAWGLPDRTGMSDRDHAKAYLDAAIRAGRGETGIFGLRLMRENLGDLTAMIDLVHPGLATDLARLRAMFGQVLFTHLAREDKLAQAVSLVKAEQTGLWHVAPDGRELERLAPPGEPRYDFDRIAARVAEFEAYDAAWTTWFDAQSITPLRIGYEAMSANPAQTVLRVCSALGVTAPTGALTPGVARLSDAVSAAWIARYRAEAGV